MNYYNPININEILYKIKELEDKIKILEQKITRLESNNNPYQEPDTNMYMI